MTKNDSNDNTRGEVKNFFNNRNVFVDNQRSFLLSRYASLNRPKFIILQGKLYFFPKILEYLFTFIFVKIYNSSKPLGKK